MKYLIDVRTKEEFEEGNAPGSIHIPFDEIENIREIIKSISNDDILELYCASGGRASFAKQILEQMGFKNVVNLGGIGNVVQEGR